MLRLIVLSLRHSFLSYIHIEDSLFICYVILRVGRIRILNRLQYKRHCS
jgi:hypothetical protein